MLSNIMPSMGYSWIRYEYDATVVFHERVTGSVGSGNFTYYALSTEGATTIFLHPLLGDPDLYIGEGDTQPTYDLSKHRLQSTTCGLERIDIPRSFKRPIGIGIYGHPSHEVSIYELEVQVDNSRDTFFDDYGYASDETASDQPFESKVQNEHYSEDGGEEESMLWTILVGILKIFLEVLTT
ncbi:UPF0669 protein C6orf120 homolog isoform X2 [Ornithodoros turicata]|uniref:UPF0669 protein C6orf120 homolog isoform X2 n=1 Tax=Ornithodoros turicata TaxID=34597 RepID=UPI0031392A6A